MVVFFANTGLKKQAAASTLRVISIWIRLAARPSSFVKFVVLDFPETKIKQIKYCMRDSTSTLKQCAKHPRTLRLRTLDGEGRKGESVGG